LFLSAGNVAAQTGLHTLDEGGNLARRLPVTCLLMSLASAGLAGIPLFSAFISKTLLEEASSEVGLAGLSYVAIAGSILSFSGLARMLWLIFAPRATPPASGESEESAQRITEAPVLALLPIAVLVVGSLLAGVQPALIADNAAIPAAFALHDRQAYIAA